MASKILQIFLHMKEKEHGELYDGQTLLILYK